jgi:hypothetical protein
MKTIRGPWGWPAGGPVWGFEFRPFRAQTVFGAGRPGRCPGLTNGCAFGAANRRPEGALFTNPGQRPGDTAAQSFPALKGRDSFRAGVHTGRPGIGFCPFGARAVFGAGRPGRCPGLTNGCAFGAANRRPEGALFTNPGQRPGGVGPIYIAALKGRDSVRACVQTGRPGIGFRPFRARTVFGAGRLGRCPGQTNCAPTGLGFWNACGIWGLFRISDFALGR